MRHKSHKIGRPKVDKQRINVNFSISDTVLSQFNDYINSEQQNASKLLETLILEHIAKNTGKNIF